MGLGFGLPAPSGTTIFLRRKKKHRTFCSCPMHNHFFGSILLSWLTVLGQLSVVRPGTGCIVKETTPTPLISNCRWHQLLQSVMENLCFVRKLTLVCSWQRINAPHCTSKSHPHVIRGVDAGGPWAMVSIPFSLIPVVYMKEQNVKTAKSTWGGLRFSLKTQCPQIKH